MRLVALRASKLGIVRHIRFYAVRRVFIENDYATASRTVDPVRGIARAGIKVDGDPADIAPEAVLVAVPVAVVSAENNKLGSLFFDEAIEIRECSRVEVKALLNIGDLQYFKLVAVT